MGAVADVQAHLATQGLVDGQTGWASARRRVHDGAHKLVVLTEDGGTAPETARATGIGDAALKAPTVQVLVRGEPWDGDASLAKAQAIYDELHGLNSTTLDGTDYLSVRAMTPEPVFAGFDDNGRPQHTTSYVLETDA